MWHVAVSRALLQEDGGSRWQTRSKGFWAGFKGIGGAPWCKASCPATARSMDRHRIGRGLDPVATLAQAPNSASSHTVASLRLAAKLP